MKTRVKWLAIPALMLSLGACGKKEQPAEPDLPEVPAAETVDATDAGLSPEPVPVLPALGATERAAKLGFVKYLPADTEVVMSFYQGAKNAERLKSLKAWQLISSEMGGAFGGGEMDFDPEMELDPEMEMEDDELLDPEFDVEQAEETDGEQDLIEPPLAPDAAIEEELGAQPEEEMADMEGAGPSALLGREVTVAMGKTAGEQTGHLLTLNKRSTYFQMRNLARLLVDAVTENNPDGFGNAFAESMGQQMFSDLLNDPESGVGLLDKMSMPPLYVAFRAEEGQIEVAAQQVAGAIQMIGMMGEMVEPLELEVAGAAFMGYKIVGESIAKMMDGSREGIEESLDPETIDRLLVAIAKKNLVVLTGTVGEYVVLFVGSGEEDLRLADAIGDSMAATDALAFGDAYADKELAALVYGQKESMRTIANSVGGLAEIAQGFRDGLASSEGLGDTRDLEALLQIVAEREAVLRKLATTEATGIVAFIEDGLKIETYGGSDGGAVDWETPLKLAHLGDPEEVVLFANMTGDATYDAAARAYLDSVFETVYAMVLKISELPLEDGDMAQFKEMATMFDDKFRQDAVALWEALSGDLAGGLGAESALVMDLRGAMPPLPGVPQAVVDEAKFPRISLIAPVTDRSKLAASWEKINASSTNILGNISEMSGMEIPMLRPFSSEKDNLTTWFFQMPFFTDEFLPSVTVSDAWFAASTSRVQAMDLIGQANAGTPGRTGLWMRANFRAMQQFATETLGVMEENSEAIFADRPAEKQDFEENKEQIREIISALDDFDKLTLHSRRESGMLRTSLHVRTR